MTDETDEALDPRFCCFCQDRPPTGTLLLVERRTQNLIGRSHMRSCAVCGQNYTDAVFGSNEAGVVAVIQYEDDRFSTPEVQSLIEPFAEQIDNMTCHACNAKIPRGEPGEPTISARDLASKMLRLHPVATSMVGTCDTCAESGQCSCCNESKA